MTLLFPIRWKLQRNNTVAVADVLRLSMADVVHDDQDLGGVNATNLSDNQSRVRLLGAHCLPADRPTDREEKYIVNKIVQPRPVLVPLSCATAFNF